MRHNQYPNPVSTGLRSLESVTNMAFENTGIDIGAVDVRLPSHMRMKTSLEFPSFDNTATVVPSLSAAVGRLLVVVGFHPIERPDSVYRADKLPGIADKLVPATFRFQRNEGYDVESLVEGRLGSCDERQTHAYTAGSVIGLVRSAIGASSKLEVFQTRHPEDQKEYLRFGQGMIVDSLRFEGKIGFGNKNDLETVNAELAREAYPPLTSIER